MLPALLALALAASPVSAGPRSAEEVSAWTQDGFGPGNTGWNPDETVVNARTIKTLKPRWTIPAPTEPEACPPRPVAPVVAGGRVFKLDAATNGVAAYDADTGTRLWGYVGAYYFRAFRLAVADGVLVVADANCDPSAGDGRIVGLDVRTGEQLWIRVNTWRSFAITMDRGVAVMGGECAGCISDIGFGLEAYRVSDGVRLWYKGFEEIAGAASARGRILLSAAGSDPFPGVPTPKWTAVDLKTGKRIWHTGIRTAGARAADPAGNYFYLGDAEGMRVVAAGTGRPLWRMNDGPVGQVAVDDRRVYASLRNQVRAYDAKTGRFLRSRAMTAPKRPIRAADLLYVQTGTAVAILSPVNGSTVALSTPFRPMTDHVVVAGGQLYITDGATLRAYAP